MSKRPLPVIDVEIELTKRAVGVCSRMMAKALTERRYLLHDGWPVEHAMCQALDEVAAAWAAQHAHQVAALQELASERNGKLIPTDEDDT